jgi:general secretion pathway protein A
LEQVVYKLETNVNKEKALLRKAILLHLDMDAIYNENSSLE